jgi:hypothetical protein
MASFPGTLSQRSYNKYIQFDSLAVDYLNGTKSYSSEVNLVWERFIGETWKSNNSGFQSLEERLNLRQKKYIYFM